MWAVISDLLQRLEPYLQFPDIIRHIVDITVVAFVLYQLLLLIRKTRAEQVLKGVVFLFFIYFVTKGLKLNTIAWILENTINFGITAVVIVFLPEIRRALEQIGRGRFFERSLLLGDDREKDTQSIVNGIADAVANMSKTRTGALIVVEKQTGINEIIETGVKLDARLTRELLENIFIPNTPLHDGAVVIRGERIAAAGCFLPLTENPNLSKQLGTRHRAALGITESSDALAIIVSEETGVISMAQNGKLTRYLDMDGLKSVLRSIYYKENDVGPLSFIKRRSKND
ncbi:MAG: TIGR00159 family protein [Clostridiales bacterium]|nr:TIGR00159 family protein [Clostridiales bacterium]